MKWFSILSEKTLFPEALEECCRRARSPASGLDEPPDLAVVFVSPQHARYYAQVAARIEKSLHPKNLIGCSAGGVIGGGKEVEQKPAISLTVAVLPEVEISSFYVSGDSLPDPDARPKSWHDLLGVSPEPEPHFVLLADPFSMNADQFVMGMDYAFPKSVKIGGLASGARAPGENALFLGGRIYRDGLVGCAFRGNIVIDSVVAQGCRPIGETHIVTACQQNILLELDQTPPMKVLEELFESLSPRDRQLLRTSLFLGIVMDAAKSSYAQGDFLIRNIMGADPEKGILAIGTELRPGQTVQFHLRDAQTSGDDLELMLSQYSARGESSAGGGAGALLFSCLGRGSYLYGVSDHDSKLFEKKVGNVPLGGFFCNGEIGPVNKTTYIHGYTSCFGIFRQKKN